MITVKLTPNEVMAAAHHALVRRVAKVNGERYQDFRTRAEKYPWDTEIESACAELALSKHFGIFWTGMGEPGAPDAGPWESRWTRHLDTGRLRINPHDSEDQRYVLIDGVAPNMRLIGWLYASEGKEQQWWQEPEEGGSKTGYWLVPRDRLKDSFEGI